MRRRLPLNTGFITYGRACSIRPGSRQRRFIVAWTRPSAPSRGFNLLAVPLGKKIRA